MGPRKQILSKVFEARTNSAKTANVELIPRRDVVIAVPDSLETQLKTSVSLQILPYLSPGVANSRSLRRAPARNRAASSKPRPLGRSAVVLFSPSFDRRNSPKFRPKLSAVSRNGFSAFSRVILPRGAFKWTGKSAAICLYLRFRCQFHDAAFAPRKLRTAFAVFHFQLHREAFGRREESEFSGAAEDPPRNSPELRPSGDPQTRPRRSLLLRLWFPRNIPLRRHYVFPETCKGFARTLRQSRRSLRRVARGGLYVLAPERIEEGLHNLYKLADELNGLTFGALTPGFFLNEKLTSIIHEYIPVNINHAQKKLHVSLTNQNTRQNVLMSAFENREYLMRCLMASCFIPLYSSGIRSEAPVIDGIPYVDGGFSENLHIFGDTPTISVSPFSGSARIAPNDQSPVAGKLFGEWRMRFGNQYLKVNMQNIVRGAQALFPPSREVLTSYWEMGYRDGMKFLLDEALFERDEGSEV
ncbi:hypothetical protein L596_014423 [Steinernema carpocapsae]|uniref:PNPLA domain-containing protein n=1 Tax=Steinernema carpocapsae TaxID=34508 RepID=A0A4U5NBW2_STECR|nr:hypothetical protein L596_014423 [Steinernema carpocapsae]